MYLTHHVLNLSVSFAIVLRHCYPYSKGRSWSLLEIPYASGDTAGICIRVSTVNKNRPIMGLRLDEILFVQLSLAESTAIPSENSDSSSVSLRQKYYDIHQEIHSSLTSLEQTTWAACARKAPSYCSLLL